MSHFNVNCMLSRISGPTARNLKIAQHYIWKMYNGWGIVLSLENITGD